MKLGGPIFQKTGNPIDWVNAVKKSGYTAAFCPLSPDSPKELVLEYVEAAKNAGIVIGEVGAWSNPLSSDELIRHKAIRKCKESLELADRIEANCCINIAGSRGEKWDGPSPLDLTDETFEMIVVTTREIIDDINPVKTFYALETMPWMYPDSPENYLKLIKAVNRKQFAVHFDPVNLICSPQRYFNNTELLKKCFKLLGSYIKSCHAKDIILRGNLTVHLDETRPGLGNLDYALYLKELDKRDNNITLMIEHLPNEDEYRLAAEYIRKTAKEHNIQL